MLRAVQVAADAEAADNSVAAVVYRTFGGQEPGHCSIFIVDELEAVGDLPTRQHMFVVAAVFAHQMGRSQIGIAKAYQALPENS